MTSTPREAGCRASPRRRSAQRSEERGRLMRGSTRKRGGIMDCVWDTVDVITGSRKQKSKGGFRTQKEAQRHLASVITQVSEGTYVEPSKQPLGQFMLDEWLPGIGGTVRPSARLHYEGTTRRYIAKRDVGAIPLRALTPGHLNALYSELEQDGLSIPHTQAGAYRRPPCAQRCRPLGEARPATLRAAQILPHYATDALRHGPPANCDGSSITSQRTACLRSGGSRRRPECDAVSCSG